MSDLISVPECTAPLNKRLCVKDIKTDSMVCRKLTKVLKLFDSPNTSTGVEETEFMMAKKFGTLPKPGGALRKVSASSPKPLKHQKALQSNIDYLCSNTTDISKLTLLLMQFHVLDFNFRSEIMSTTPEEQQFYLLYYHVWKKDEAAYELLLEALKRSGNTHIKRTLEEFGTTGSVVSLYVPEPSSAPDERDSENPRTLRKRDIFRFCVWGIIAVSLLIISAVMLTKQIVGSADDKNNNRSGVHPLSNSTETGVKPSGVTLDSGQSLIPHHHHHSDSEVPNFPPPGTKPVDDQTAQSNYSYVSLVVSSLEGQVPSLLLVRPQQPTKINLTISSTEKYDWRVWVVDNPEAVHSLTLKGRFNESDVHFFLQTFKNIRHLGMSHGSYLCAEFCGNNNSDYGVEAHPNVETLRISILPECELLYMYLDQALQLPRLNTLIFERVFISRSNFPFIQSFLRRYQGQLVKLIFSNVTLCDTCEIFKDLVFSNLDEARIFFYNAETTAAAKTVRNFNEASRYLTKFYSNVSCKSLDERTLVENWQHLKTQADVCVR